MMLVGLLAAIGGDDYCFQPAPPISTYQR